MLGKCELWSVGKITPMETQIETKNYFVLQAYCPSLLIDFNETCTTCSALLEGSRCVIAVKSFLWKPRYSRKGTLFSMESASHY